MALTHLIMYHI